MRRFFLVAAMALSLAGCATTGGALTLSTSNPVKVNQLAAVEAGYGAALSVALKYKHLPLCKTGTNELSGALCARRSVIVKIQSANRVAHASVVTARNFVRQHPTVDATAVISTAMDAVSQFRAAIPSSGGI